jgi:ABC-type transporter Mla MlaB component
MALKDKPPGFLSKMVQFIRQPAKDQRDADASELGQNSEFIKLALKERIERKRQDDTVRRREFAYLRKLRSNGALAGHFTAGRPSVFQNSSGFNPEERAMTIKKIDDIEAHMSRNWLDRKPDKAPVQQGNRPASPPVLSTPVGMGIPKHREAPTPPVLLVDVVDDTDADYDFTKMDLSAPAAVPMAVADAPTQAMALEPEKSDNTEPAASGFSGSQLMSIEMGDVMGDPNLQDAAIRFADGDYAGAEAVLMAVLQSHSEEQGSADACAAALFDLYRATGQQASFDVVAIDYAERFGRSAPEWFSIPDLLGRKASALPVERAVPVAPSGEMAWTCPVELDLPSVQALRTAMAHPRVAPHLQWVQLKVIAPDALDELAQLFEQWCAQPLTLHFSGVDALEKTLKAATPSGDMRVDQLWWRLRLDVLCILRKQEEFENTALDYCVLYEVSPPSWRDVRCVCVYESASDRMSGPSVDAGHSHFSVFDQHAADVATVELSGDLLGDALEALNELQQELNGADHLVISCARLVRVDFSAAGSILNWVAERESQGCRIVFSDVSRLVAAFFNVIGISEHATVVLRTK